MTDRFVCLVAAGLLIAGCSTPTSSRYEGAEVGRPIETSRGTIVSGRVVNVIGETNVIGPAAGAAIGGASVGLGTHSGWAAILGAVFGAGIGYATQQLVNDRDGIEYIVEMEDGRTVTLVQNRDDDEVPLRSGTTVLVQVSGAYSRVIPRTPPIDRPEGGAGGTSAASGSSPAAAGAPPGGGGWIDPDKPATAGPASTSAPSAVAAPHLGGTGNGGVAAPAGQPPASQLMPSAQSAPSARTSPGPLASNSISSWAVPPPAEQ